MFFFSVGEQADLSRFRSRAYFPQDYFVIWFDTRKLAQAYAYNTFCPALLLFILPCGMKITHKNE